MQLRAFGRDRLGGRIERRRAGVLALRREAQLDGVDELLALEGLEVRGALHRLLGLRRLVLGQVGEQARHRAPRFGEGEQADAEGGELVARHDGEDLLQQAQRIARAERLVNRGALGEPGEGGRVAVRLGEEVVEEAVELLRRPLGEAVGEHLQGARVGLPDQRLAEEVRPVLPPLAHHGVGALAQQAVLDAGEDALRLVGEEGVRRPVDVRRRAPRPLEGEPDLEGEAGIGVDRGLGHPGEVGRHARAQLRVARPLAAQAVDPAARIGALEGLPHRVEGVAAGLRPVVGLAAGAARHHLRVLARRPPPGGPLRLADDAVQDIADLAGGERPAVALEDRAQQLRRRERLERRGLLDLAPQHVRGAERLQQLGRRLEADHQPLVALEVDLEALEAEVGLDHPPDPLALHRHHGADVEGEQGLQPVDLLPGLRDVLRRAVQADRLEQPLEGAAVAVELVEGRDDGGVGLVGRQQQRPGALQELQARRPVPALAELLVEHLQEVAGAPLLAVADQGARHADEVVEVRRVLFEAGQPLPLERGVVALRQVVLDVSGDRHRGDGR